MTKKGNLILVLCLLSVGCSSMDGLKDSYYKNLVLFDTSDCTKYADKQQFCEKQKLEEQEKYKTAKMSDCESISTGDLEKSELLRNSCRREVAGAAQSQDSDIVAPYKLSLSSFKTRAEQIPNQITSDAYQSATQLKNDLMSSLNKMPLNPSEMIDIRLEQETLLQQLENKIAAYEGDKSLREFADSHRKASQEEENQRNQKSAKAIAAFPNEYKKCQSFKKTVEEKTSEMMKLKSEPAASTKRQKEILKEADGIAYQIDKLTSEAQKLNCRRFYN